MTIAELIELLERIKKEHGDKLIVTMGVYNTNLVVHGVEVKETKLDYGKIVKLYA